MNHNEEILDIYEDLGLDMSVGRAHQRACVSPVDKFGRAKRKKDEAMVAYNAARDEVLESGECEGSAWTVDIHDREVMSLDYDKLIAAFGEEAVNACRTLRVPTTQRSS
ncbi:hypothetical protein J2X72_003930 [Phyllobacterium sp. 1468]|uniref:hypothetical protein n=1 Tax=Phyllobacterium sp. 1468 TaxID=2817759 RepID=UPI00285F769F|nr:hypothetical protein [Phyllobacterium sp. 1468]MDR6635118.1 hypothetical protein [Phyllobacterium sp. 1468]